MVLSWENTNLNHCKQQQNDVRLTTFSFFSCYYNQDKFKIMHGFCTLNIKFVLFDVTGLFIRDQELELPSCGCRKRDGTSSGVSFIISLLEF